MIIRPAGELAAVCRPRGTPLVQCACVRSLGTRLDAAAAPCRKDARSVRYWYGLALVGQGRCSETDSALRSDSAVCDKPKTFVLTTYVCANSNKRLTKVQVDSKGWGCYRHFAKIFTIVVLFNAHLPRVG